MLEGAWRGGTSRILGDFSALRSWLGFFLGVQPSGWGLQRLMAMGLQDHIKGTRLRLTRERVWEGKGGKTGVFEGVKCQILS